MDNARESVLSLEKEMGLPLRDVPVSNRDQWTAMVRDHFAGMEVDLGSTTDARAAFSGAYVMFGALANGGAGGAVAATHLMRYLMDRSDGAREVPRFHKIRVWLASKVMPR